VLISISATHYGKAYREHAQETVHALSQLRAEGEQLALSLSTFDASETTGRDDYAARSVESNLASTMMEIMRARVPFGVFYSSIATQSLAARSAGGEHLNMKQLSAPLKGSGADGLKTIALQIKGRYRDYGLAKQFFHFLHQLPVVTTRLHLHEDAFEMDILVLGK